MDSTRCRSWCSIGIKRAVAEPSSVTFATGNLLTKRAAEQLAAPS
jgi:hypothetical protein